MGAPAIRGLAAADLDRVVAIDQGIAGRPRRGFYAKRLAALGEDPRALLGLGAEDGGKLLGFLFADVLDGEFGGKAPVGVLGAIGVDRAAARRGVATALREEMERLLGARGVREIRTEVEWSDHDLTAFFAAAGFRLSRRIVLERQVGDPPEEPEGSDEFTWEQLPVRSLAEGDLPAIVQIDRRITGRDRTPYYQRKAAEVLRRSGVRVSLVAEVDHQPVGFLMARVDLGEFGRTEPTAVLDTIGVHPGFARKNVGRALLYQLLNNLASLRVERVVTQVEWDHVPLVRFLSRTGFQHSQRLAFEKLLG